MIGTQSVTAPSINHVKALIDDGFVGKVLSTSMIASAGAWSGETDAASYYLNERANGATM